MSLAKDLEIYKAADSLLAFALRFQAQVPRAYRVAVGQQVSTQCVQILLLVARANIARGTSRAGHIETLLEQLEAITALLRASHNSAMRVLSTKAWAESIELTDRIGKQAHGWLKSARNGGGDATTGTSATATTPPPAAPAPAVLSGTTDCLFSAAPAA